MPGVFRDNWMIHAKAYYAFESMGQTEKLHYALMEAMHVKKQHIVNEKQLTNFVSKQGLDGKAFTDAYNSFSVDALSRQAKIMTGRYEITGVPSIVVDGRYLVTTTTAGPGELFNVINYLVKLSVSDRQAEAVKK